MPGIDWRLAREQKERSAAAGHTHGRNCRENDNNGDTRIGKGNGGGGVTGDQWLQWGGMERGGRLRPTHLRGPEIHPKVSRNFYIAVTQQVLLFGAETWVLTKNMEAALEAFQGRVARRLMGRMPRRGRDGKWMYLPLAGATKEAGIVQARTLVLQR